MNPPIYLDHNATTPVAPEVAEAMWPFLHQHFGNPSSSHPYGRIARAALAEARDEVAQLIGALPDEIVFTGCATEANNLALLGVAHATAGSGQHLLVSAIEHPAVMVPARHLEQQGWRLDIVPVDATGRVDAAGVAALLRADTTLISIMHANNEIGTLQPVAEIGRLLAGRGIVFHCDAAQSVGKLAVDVQALGVDLLTLAGHKFGAAKGVGALYVRRGTRLAGILFGADQEHGRRPGTENVPAIVGLGVAAKLARTRLPGLSAELTARRDRLHRQLADGVPGLILNGHPVERLPNTLHVSFPGVTGAALLADVEQAVAASVGSACHAGSTKVSGVLAALGATPERAAGAVRLSVGGSNSEAEIDHAARVLIEAWRRLSGRG